MDCHSIQSIMVHGVTQAIPYRNEYLWGSDVFAYSAGPVPAEGAIRPPVRSAVSWVVRADIGGDHQQINSLDINYTSLGLRYLLLPTWTWEYHHGRRDWRVTVNGCTGAVRGRYPRSPAKVIAAMLTVVITIMLMMLLLQRLGQS